LKNREKRERLVKLRDCVLRLRRIGSEAAQQYREEEWWSSSGGLEARNAIVELRPYIQQEWPKLEAGLLEVTWSYDAASSAFIAPATPERDRSLARRDQSRHAELLTQQASDTAVKIHNL